MNILRVYLPAECDEQMNPLDWERCRKCKGHGGLPDLSGDVVVARTDNPAHFSPTQGAEFRIRSCPTCNGHGSLKAAALAYLSRRCNCSAGGSTGGCNPQECTTDCNCYGLRCEDCGHPMSDGTWEGVHRDHHALLVRAGAVLREGLEPHTDPDGEFDALVGAPGAIHYSPCDEGCRHGGPGRWRFTDSQMWALADLGANAEGEVVYSVLDDRRDAGAVIEASWRAVDVRRLHYPNMLRPEDLAVLCLRCWAARA